MKKLVTLLLLALFILPSCLKSSKDEPEIIIDGRTFESATVWKEIEIQNMNVTQDSISKEDWEMLPEGNTLTLFLNTQNDSLKGGIYQYNPIHLSLNIDSTGDVFLEDSLFHFLKEEVENRDTLATVSYLMHGDSVLIIQNLSTSPGIALKFKREVTHKDVIH